MARRQPLRLSAQGQDDIPVMSAAFQDAVAQLGDFKFDRNSHRLTAVFNRFRWEDGSLGQGWRTRSALDVSGVLSVQSKRLKKNNPAAIVSLLSLTFDAGDSPGGILNFSFSGGGEIRLTVECIDLLLVDISEPWPARQRPGHPLDKTA